MEEAFKEQKKDIEKRKLKIAEIKKKMNIPIDPFPEQEMCEYEKLREKNIQEREEAMTASKFFEHLNAYKKEVGFSKRTKGSEVGSKKKALDWKKTKLTRTKEGIIKKQRKNLRRIK